MLRSTLMLALIFCAVLMTVQSAPAGNDHPTGSESKVSQDRNDKSSSEEEDVEDKNVDMKSTALDSTLPSKERRELLGNAPQDTQHHNLSGVTHRPADQTTLKVETSPATPTTTVAERSGFLGPVQLLFP